jgi:hypothetical protein
MTNPDDHLEDMAVRILVTYQRRSNGYTMIHSLLPPVNDILKRFGWASMVSGSGWLIPSERLRAAGLALRGNDITLVDADEDLRSADATLIPPSARTEQWAPQPECRECGRPYKADARAGDGESCWSCGAPLVLIRRPVLTLDERQQEADHRRWADEIRRSLGSRGEHVP